MTRKLKYFIGYAVLTLLWSLFLYQHSIGNHTFLFEFSMLLLCSIFLSLFIFIVEVIIKLILLSERIEIEWLCIWFADLILIPFKKIYDIFRMIYSFCRKHTTFSKILLSYIIFSPFLGQLFCRYTFLDWDRPRNVVELFIATFLGCLLYTFIDLLYQGVRTCFVDDWETIGWSLIKNVVNIFKYAFITHPKKLIIKQEKKIENEITDDFLLKNSFDKNPKTNSFEQTIEINGKAKSKVVISFDPIGQDGKQTLNAIVIFYGVDGQNFVKRTFSHVWLTKKQFYDILTNTHDLKIDVPFHTTYH